MMIKLNSLNIILYLPLNLTSKQNRKQLIIISQTLSLGRYSPSGDIIKQYNTCNVFINTIASLVFSVPKNLVCVMASAMFSTVVSNFDSGTPKNVNYLLFNDNQVNPI